MHISRTLLAAAGIAMALPVYAAENIAIHDAYARASTAMSVSGAAFMVIDNRGAADDRLVSASSDVAERVELHTHLETDGVMRMVEVEEGFAIPAGERHALARGGDHVMFLGLRAPLVHGETVEVTLSFEQAGDLVVEIPVDLERGADHGHSHGHSHGHGQDAGHSHGDAHGHGGQHGHGAGGMQHR